jgi:hypothetical protein
VLPDFIKRLSDKSYFIPTTERSCISFLVAMLPVNEDDLWIPLESVHESVPWIELPLISPLITAS